jgi:hypothetical protein
MCAMRPPIRLVLSAFICGFIATVPAGVVAANHLNPDPMTITVTFLDGTVATFTHCTDYRNDGGVLHLRGQDQDGHVVTMEYNWTTVASVRIQ